MSSEKCWTVKEFSLFQSGEWGEETRKSQERMGEVGGGCATTTQGELVWAGSVAF